MSKFKDKLRRKCRGAAIVEAALCLPILLYLIFFVLEAIRIAIFQVSLDRMVLEAVFEYAAYKKVDNFQEIITRCSPSFLKANDVRYCIHVYPDLDSLIQSTPKVTQTASSNTGSSNENNSGITSNNSGGTSGSGTNSSTNSGSNASSSNSSAPKYEFAQDAYWPASDVGSANVIFLGGSEEEAGAAFELTFVCNYKFTSDFVASLFNGGSNAEDATGNPIFILWSRAICVCN